MGEPEIPRRPVAGGGRGKGQPVHADRRGAMSENLGLYGLLQRRCTLIVASDCSQEDRSQKPGSSVRRLDPGPPAGERRRRRGRSSSSEARAPFGSSRAKGPSVDVDVDDESCRHKRLTGLHLVLPVDSKEDAEKVTRRMILKSRRNRTRPRSRRRRAIQNSAPPGGTRSPPG